MSKTLLAVSRAHFFQAGMSEWKLTVQRQTSRNFAGRSGSFSARVSLLLVEIPSHASLAGFHFFPRHLGSSVHLFPVLGCGLPSSPPTPQ